MRKLFAAVALAAAVATPAFADQTDGVVTSFDVKTGTLIMGDKTVWLLPSDIKDVTPGTRVRIAYTTAGEDGLTGIKSVERM